MASKYRHQIVLAFDVESDDLIPSSAAIFRCGIARLTDLFMSDEMLEAVQMRTEDWTGNPVDQYCPECGSAMIDPDRCEMCSWRIDPIVAIMRHEGVDERAALRIYADKAGQLWDSQHD